MRILFAVVDGGGNLPPQLGVARALRARGTDVAFIGHTGVRERVKSAGFPFETFSCREQFDIVTQRPLLALMGDFVRIATDRRLGHDIVAAAHRFHADIVVVDMILTAAAAEVSAHLPTVVFVHSFYRAAQDLAAGPVGRLMRLRGIDPLGAERSGALQIVSARADLDPVRGAPPVSHTGVVWQGMPVPSTPAPVPRILVSLSTCAFAGQRRMLQAILNAVGPLQVHAIVTVGPGIDASGLRVPSNTSVHTWLYHDEVLASASLVVGHGGHSTTMRALSFGVPLVILPANPMIDQKTVGSSVANIVAGIRLRKHAGAARIRRAIETVLGDPGYRESAGRIGIEIRERDGAETAADLIGQFARLRSHL